MHRTATAQPPVQAAYALQPAPHSPTLARRGASDESPAGSAGGALGGLLPLGGGRAGQAHQADKLVRAHRPYHTPSCGVAPLTPSTRRDSCALAAQASSVCSLHRPLPTTRPRAATTGRLCASRRPRKEMKLDRNPGSKDGVLHSTLQAHSLEFGSVSVPDKTPRIIFKSK